MTKMEEKTVLFPDNDNYRLQTESTSFLNGSDTQLSNHTTLYEFGRCLVNEDSINANDLNNEDIVAKRSETSHAEYTGSRNANYDTFMPPVNKLNDGSIESLNVRNDLPLISDPQKSTTELNNNSLGASNLRNDSNSRNELQENKVSNQNKNPNDPEKEIRSVNLLSQGCYIPHGITSEVLIRETELELNKLQSLTSRSNHQVNQAIYKLAYDESLTDQSETEDLDSASESADKDSCCPPSQDSRSEILVHEADSASDAGSEDVELLPHRCTFENSEMGNKHIYVNNLSLAVELLRTKENLPYDSEFKRLCDTDPHKNKPSQVDAIEHSRRIFITGTVNPGFVQDRCDGALTNGQIEEQHGISHFTNAQTSNIASMDYQITQHGLQSGDEIGEDAREAVRNLQDPVLDIDEQNNHNLGGGRSHNYRRIGNRARQQLNLPTSRSNIINPCFCCVIM